MKTILAVFVLVIVLFTVSLCTWVYNTDVAPAAVSTTNK